MKNIKDLILSVPGFREPQKDKIIVSGIIKNLCGFEIETKNIDFNNHNLRLNVSHTEKSAIYMKKTEVLKAVQEKIPDRQIQKIA